jgi:hypothetical protein
MAISPRYPFPVAPQASHAIFRPICRPSSEPPSAALKRGNKRCCGQGQPGCDQDRAPYGRRQGKQPMADEGAGGNIAGEQHRADNPGDPGGERQRPPEQTLLGERGATQDGCRMESSR